jgi:starvation-inducible DNA-binding protein
MAIRIGLLDATRDAVVKIRSALRADGYVLSTKRRNDHWNVGRGGSSTTSPSSSRGKSEERDDVVHEVAERARALGGTAVGPSPSSRSSPGSGEEPGRCREAPRMLANLLADYEAVVRRLRTDLQTVIDRQADGGPRDFLTGLMEQPETMAWMRRAFRPGK